MIQGMKQEAAQSLAVIIDDYSTKKEDHICLQ